MLEMHSFAMTAVKKIIHPRLIYFLHNFAKQLEAIIFMLIVVEKDGERNPCKK